MVQDGSILFDMAVASLPRFLNIDDGYSAVLASTGPALHQLTFCPDASARFPRGFDHK
jgi:hypothetical protein